MNNSLFEGSRMTMDESIQLTIDALDQHLDRYDHLAIAYSGGKDSSATVTLLAHLMESGKVRTPSSVTVLYADTRLELTPLHHSAMSVMKSLPESWTKQIVLPEMDDRFFVYMLGRGVPPPSNTFRWCTSQLKIEPMEKALVEHAVSLGLGEMVPDVRKGREHKQIYRGFGTDKMLMITGVRLGESAARDQRIALSCSKDGSECGQGWLQQSAKEGLNDTLAPLLHWRVCHVWDWLNFFAPDHGFPTRMIAESYGGDEALEINARTGCVGCNLASRDLALETILKKYPEKWGYLAPLMRLRPMYAEMKKPENRLRKYGERLQDGSLAANQGRLGPLTLDARRRFFKEVLQIQRDINNHSPDVDANVWLIDYDERFRISELIEAETWPNGWSGKEMRGDEMTDRINRDGTIQPWMFEGES